MARLIILFVAIAALALAGVWVVEHPGRLALDWQGWRIETSLALAVAVAAALLLLAGLLLALVRWLLGQGFGRERALRRRRAGYAEFARGMVALAAGDARGAASAAAKVEKLLPEPSLTLLLSAQAAQLAGDDAGARTRFTAMLERKDTELLGLRGLLSQAVQAGDDAAVRDLAARAAKLRPDAPWALAALFDADIGMRDWRGAGAALDQAIKAKAIGAGEGATKKAALQVEQAREARAANDLRAARKAAEAAVAQRRDFPPAAVELAAIYAALGKRRRARNTLSAAWAAAPHSSLIASWLALLPEAATAEQRQRHLLELVGRVWSDHPAARLALAEAFTASGDFPRAREQLAGIGEPGPAALAAEAALDLRQYGDGRSNEAWRAKAAQATPDAAWICTSCHNGHAEWSALCPSCGAFAKQRWERPRARPAVDPQQKRLASS